MIRPERVGALALVLVAVAIGAGCQAIAGIEDRRFEPALQGSAECETYCNAVQSGCTAGYTAYATRDQCILTCAKLPSGEANADNSIECRTAQAKLAVETDEPAVHCPAAGPFGAGKCGSTCEAYCTLLAAACPSKLDGIANCETACSGLRADAKYDLAELATGDSVECRIGYAVKALEDPDAFCGAAALKSDKCLDPADGEPSCADFCKLVGVACTGSNQMYASTDQCLKLCAELDKGTNNDLTSNTAACRKYHSYNSLAAPVEHCPHAGPAGDGHCGKNNCEAYCQLFERVCDTQFKSQFASAAACMSACGALSDGAADKYGAADPLGNTVRCRVQSILLVVDGDGSKCIEAGGGGECAN